MSTGSYRLQPPREPRSEEKKSENEEDVVTSPAAVGRENPRIDLVQGGPIGVNRSWKNNLIVVTYIV